MIFSKILFKIYESILTSEDSILFLKTNNTNHLIESIGIYLNRDHKLMKNQLWNCLIAVSRATCQSKIDPLCLFTILWSYHTLKNSKTHSLQNSLLLQSEERARSVHDIDWKLKEVDSLIVISFTHYCKWTAQIFPIYHLKHLWILYLFEMD